MIQLLRHPHNSEPVGRQNFGSRLDLHGMPAEMRIPLGLDNSAASLRHLLPFKRLEKTRKPLGPAAFEIDILETADTEELLKSANFERDDEIGILELLCQVLRD